MNEITLTILKLIAGGRGLAQHNGKPVFVAGVLPDEEVRVRLRADQGSFAEAELLEVLKPSPFRVKSRCPVFGDCGGCQWQFMHYDAQCAWKQAIVFEQLQRIGKIEKPVVLETLPATDPWNYRSRIQLHIDDEDRVGFYRSGSHEVVEFDECHIASAEVNARLEAAKQQLRETGSGRHVRSDDGDGFTQVNPQQNDVLRAVVAAGVAEREPQHVVELYCGNGNLTTAFAEHVQQVDAVDDHAGSIEQARAQAPSNVDYHCTAAHKLLTELASGGATIDGILLDPPRRGAAETMDAIINAQPQWICYVSCDPATLARDIRTLTESGYRLECCQPIDMFPQTYHVETVSWLSRHSTG